MEKIPRSASAPRARSPKRLALGFFLVFLGLIVDIPFFPFGMQVMFNPHNPLGSFSLLILVALILLPLFLIGYGLYTLFR